MASLLYVTLSKTIFGVAKALVVIGALLLAFMGYQLWGTDIQHNLAQNSLENELDNLFKETDASPDASIETQANAPDEPVNISSISQRGPFEVGTPIQIDASVNEFLPLLYRDSGEAVASITISKIGVDEVVVEGTQVGDLRKGPGHYGSTPLPGQPGNVSIAGHRTTYGAPFANINKLEEGDEIAVRTIQGLFVYRVIDLDSSSENSYRIVSPSQSSELHYKEGNHLTLTSCHPRFSARQRIIVRAELVGNPVVPLPRTISISDSSQQEQVFLTEESPEIVVGSFGSGLNGNQGVVPSILLWFFAAAGIALAAWFAGKYWKRWASYLIGAVPLLSGIFMFFYYLDTALPSY